MPFSNDLPEDFRMFLNILTNAEEGGLRIVLLQLFQNPGGDLWDGAVIKSEVDAIFSSRSFPDPFWIDPFDESGNALSHLKVHSVLIKNPESLAVKGLLRLQVLLR